MTDHKAETIILYIGFAVAYAIAGYMSNVLQGKMSFEPGKFFKTVLIGVIAGGVIAFRGDDPTPEGYDAAVVIAIPIVDQMWNSVSEIIHDNKQTDDGSN